jgi:hypothetical protein
MKAAGLVASILLLSPVILAAQGLNTAKIDDAMGRSARRLARFTD